MTKKKVLETAVYFLACLDVGISVARLVRLINKGK